MTLEVQFQYYSHSYNEELIEKFFECILLIEMRCLGFFTYQPLGGGGLLSRYSGRDRPLFSSLMFPLYMSGEELIWEAAMMIFICDIAPAVAGCITFSGAKLAGIVILQGHAQLPRNNPQNLTLCIKFGPS